MVEKSNTYSDIWQSMFQCGVCGKTVNQSDCPLLLRCCHSACKQCVQQLKQNSSNNAEVSHYCNICFQEFSPSDCVENLFLMYYMLNESNKSMHSNERICLSCVGENKLALIKCDTCDWICKQCFDAHKKLKVFKDHNIEESEKCEQSLEEYECHNSICLTHNKPKKMYCETCTSVYCSRCILKDHNFHKYEDSLESAKQFSFYISALLPQFNEKRSSIESTLKLLETIETDISEQRNSSIENIKSVIKKLKEKLEDLGNSFLDDFNSACQQKIDDLHSKKSQLVALNDSFSHMQHFIQFILRQNVPIAILITKQLLKDQLQNLLNKPCTQPYFEQPFIINVFDRISDESREFSIYKMIEEVFRVCFKIKTSDELMDNKSKSSGNSPVLANNNDEDIEMIIPEKTIQSSLSTNKHNIRDATHLKTITRFHPLYTQTGCGPMSALKSYDNRESHHTNSAQRYNSSPNSSQVYQRKYLNKVIEHIITDPPVVGHKIYKPHGIYLEHNNVHHPNIVNIVTQNNVLNQTKIAEQPMQQTPFMRNLRVMSGGTITTNY